MKSLIVVSLVSSFASTIAQAAAPPMRDAATHEQLVVIYRQASQEDPIRKHAPSKGPDPSTASKPKSMIAESDMICFNGNVTLVPKRAILQMPKNLTDRLKYQPGAKLLSWADFFALNRGWITTVEVSRTQAEGNIPLAPETQKQMVKSGNLIVATYQAGPISVLPLKVPDENAAKAPDGKAATTTTPPKS